MIDLALNKRFPFPVILVWIALVCANMLSSTGDSTGCSQRLLRDRDKVPDLAFEHSSAVNPQHGASAARDDPADEDLQQYAWCPDALVGSELREFMQVDLGRPVVVKLIITKGRVARSKGHQTTPFFHVKYRRELTSSWMEYRKENGTTRLNGNSDAMTENYNTMEPPFVARFIRIYPFSVQPVKTCLKLELLGCEVGGLIEYSAPSGSLLSSTSPDSSPLMMTSYDRMRSRHRLTDSTYDWPPTRSIDSSDASRIEEGGLGKLVDNDFEQDVSISPMSSFKYVGWNRDEFKYTTPTPSSSDHHYQPICLVFRFDSVYEFSTIRLLASNAIESGIELPRNITVDFALNKSSLTSNKEMEDDDVFHEPGRDWNRKSSRWITLTDLTPSSPSFKDESKLPLAVGKFVKLCMQFQSQWIAISEIDFENRKIEDPRLLALLEERERERLGRKSASNAESSTITSNQPIETPSSSNRDGAESTDNDNFPLTQYQASTLNTIIICILVFLFALLLVGMFCCLFNRRRRGRQPSSWCGRLFYYHRPDGANSKKKQQSISSGDPSQYPAPPSTLQRHLLQQLALGQDEVATSLLTSPGSPPSQHHITNNPLLIPGASINQFQHPSSCQQPQQQLLDQLQPHHSNIITTTTIGNGLAVITASNGLVNSGGGPPLLMGQPELHQLQQHYQQRFEPSPLLNCPPQFMVPPSVNNMSSMNRHMLRHLAPPPTTSNALYLHDDSSSQQQIYTSLPGESDDLGGEESQPYAKVISPSPTPPTMPVPGRFSIPLPPPPPPVNGGAMHHNAWLTSESGSSQLGSSSASSSGTGSSLSSSGRGASSKTPPKQYLIDNGGWQLSTNQPFGGTMSNRFGSSLNDSNGCSQCTLGNSASIYSAAYHLVPQHRFAPHPLQGGGYDPGLDLAASINDSSSFQITLRQQ